MQEHVNLVGRDSENGPILVSMKSETVAGQEHWRVLLRIRSGSTHELVPSINLEPNPSPAKMVKVNIFSYFFFFDFSNAVIILYAYLCLLSRRNNH